MIDACPVPNVNDENQEHVVHIQGIKEKKETKKCLPLARGETWTKRNDVLGQEYLESVWQFAEVCEDWTPARCLERSIDHLLTFPRRNLPSPQLGHMFGKTINSEEVCGLSEFRSTVTVCGEERRRKVPLRREDEENYRISPDPLETVCASFHQQSGRRGLSKYRGSQCTSMALGAVLVSKSIPVNYWGTKELDGILKFGDRFHAEQLSKLERDLLDTRLALHEIKAGENHSYRVPIPCPKSKWFDKNYSKTGTIFFSKSAEFYGPIQQSHDCSGLEDLGESRLDVAVRTVLDQGYDGAIITVGNVSGAIIRDLHGRLRYFDSHCNNKIGRMCLDGTAVLLAFDSVEAFVRHIRKRERQSKCRYELVGVNVHLAQECGEDQRSD